MKINRLVSFFLLTVFLSSVIYSQSKIWTSLGGGVSLPSGELQDDLELKTGWAGYGTLEYKLNSEYTIYLVSGFNQWKGGSQKLSVIVDAKIIDFEAEVEADNIPVLLGAKYFFDKHFYASAEIGANLINEELKLTVSSDGRNIDYSDIEKELDPERKAKFGFGFGAGYQVQVNPKMTLELNAKFLKASSDFNYIDVKAAFGFALL